MLPQISHIYFTDRTLSGSLRMLASTLSFIFQTQNRTTSPIVLPNDVHFYCLKYCTNNNKVFPLFIQSSLMHEAWPGSLLHSHTSKRKGSLISSLVSRGVVMFFWALPVMLKHMLDHSECLGGTIHFSGLAGLQGREHFCIRDSKKKRS